MRKDWWSCDGNGGREPVAKTPASERSIATAGVGPVSRRNLLMGLGMGALTWATRKSALAQVAFTPPAKDHDRNVLVTIFFRGGADALNVVTPHGDDNYYRNRPTLSIARPGDRSVGEQARLLDLDGFFGLNPALAALLPLYKEGHLGFVHACGSNDQTRSHFEAMRAMESGLPSLGGSTSSGWISRHLDSSPKKTDTPLRAVAFSSVMPDSLRGASNAIAMESLSDFRIEAPKELSAYQVGRLKASLQDIYGLSNDEMAEAGRETLQVLQNLNNLDLDKYQADNGAKYPTTDIGTGLKQVAILIKSGVGLEVAFLDKGGWDTHFGQGSTAGFLFNNLQDVAQALSAFNTDLGGEMSRVTVVIQSEFGRRLAENYSLGTDHGHGGMMWAMGGGIKGGKVYGKWPGLGPDHLVGPGDLAVTTDYRNVLAEVLHTRLGNADAASVFPGLSEAPVGICRA